MRPQIARTRLIRIAVTVSILTAQKVQGQQFGRHNFGFFAACSPLGMHLGDERMIRHLKGNEANHIAMDIYALIVFAVGTCAGLALAAAYVLRRWLARWPLSLLHAMLGHRLASAYYCAVIARLDRAIQ